MMKSRLVSRGDLQAEGEIYLLTCSRVISMVSIPIINIFFDINVRSKTWRRTQCCVKASLEKGLHNHATNSDISDEIII